VSDDLPRREHSDTLRSRWTAPSPRWSNSRGLGGATTLHYQSDRVPGFVRGYTIKIPLTGPTVEPTLRGVQLEVTTAGQVFRRLFPAMPSQSFDYVWNGRDAFGRVVQGAQTAVVRVGFVYQASVSTQSAQARAEDFARNTGETPGRSTTEPITITPGRADDELVIWRRWEQSVGVWDVRREGLGGWSLSAQHRYDPVAQAVLHGDGTIHSAQSLGPVLRTMVGTGQPRGSEDPIPDDSNAATTRVAGLRSMALATDGSVYVAESYRVHRVSPAGFLRTVAGTGARGSSGDNGPALAAQLDTVNAVAVLREGSVLIGERLRVRRLRRDGVIEPFAGTGAEGDSGDGGPALAAQFRQIRAITQTIDGSVLIADENANRVRRVSNSGTISTVYGTGEFGASTYDSAAARTRASAPASLAVDANGSIYVGVFGRVARIDPDGIVRHVVGLRSGTSAMDGGLASQFALRSQSPQVALASDGTLFVSDDSVVLSVREGIARVLTRVDSSTGDRTPEGASAKGATLYAQNALIAHPNGSLWVNEGGIGRVRAITPTLPGLPITDVAVPSTDGSVLDVFGASGRHERVLDARNGRVLQRFVYNSAGYLDRIEDDATNVLRIERNAMGVATAIVAPFGQRTTLTVNAQGDLESVRDPAMREWRMRYSGAGGQLVGFTDARMGAHTFTYDPAGLLQRDTGPDGAVVSLTRTDTANSVEVSVSNALGNPTRFRMSQDGAGVLEHTTVRADGLNSVTRIPRDGTMVTTLPDRTTLTQRAKPDPVWGMRVPLAERVEIATPGGLRMVSSQDRAVTLRAPNDPTSVTSMTDTFTVNGRRSQRTWDAATRTWTLRSPMGRVTTMVEDVNGRLVEARMAGFETMRWTYDARGRVDSASQGMRTQRVGYDAAGNAANNTDALMRMHSATFDSVGRVLTATSSDGRTTSASWDSHDNVTSVTPPGAMAHRFTYTAQDLLETAVPPSAPDGDPTSRTQWDANQRPTSWMAPGGRGATFAYDAANRIESVTTPEGTYRFTYNATSGHLETASNPAGASLAFSYDGSLPTEVRWSGDVAGTVARSYDNDFRVTRERVNGANDIAYAYDDDGLLTSVGPVTLARSATNGVIELVSVGTAETSTTLDGYGSPTRITSRVGATTVLDEELTYDGLGRIARKIERVEGVASTIEYAFDGADRLREVRRNGAVTETYAYDANGNRTRAVVDGVTRMGTVDAQDRMQSYGEWTYAYSREGQWTERRHTGNGQLFRYRYDVGGALREVTLPTGRRIEYVIDASGRRVGRRVDGAWTQRWLYRDGLRPIAELDAAGAVQSVFVYGARANVPDAIVRGGRVYRVVSDHLGSVRRVVDSASGAVVQRLSYDAYGRVTEDSAPGWQPFGYAGGLYDSDTGLVRFGARDYDALSGRWTAKDPSGLAGGLNLYEYAAGDPVDLIDVDGNNPLVVFLAEIVSNAIWSAMIDILIQVAMDGPRCINWGQVWGAAKSGAFFGGLFGVFKAWNAPWFCLTGCFVAGTWVDTEHGRRPIEEVALGERVGPESDECRTVSTENWVDIGLEMGPREEGAPGHVVLHLLRPREWAERHGAREGESIELALRELNIEGSARVTSVQSAPALSAGSRCPVTGTIRRSGVSVIAVEFERGAPMELTANHRVFSATRNGWVAAGDLLAGEALQAQEGAVRVRSVHASERGLTTVFNLEVFARHEFFVGEERVRVHNGYNAASRPTFGHAFLEHGKKRPARDLMNRASTATTTPSGNVIRTPQGHWQSKDQDVADWLSSFVDDIRSGTLTSAVDVPLPGHLSGVVYEYDAATSSIVTRIATQVRIVPREPGSVSGGIRTAFPIF
jgi:RHS repeat-associated protein